MIAKLKNLVDDCHQRLKTSRIGFNYLSCSRGFSVELIKRESMGFCDERIASEFCSSLNDGDGVEIDLDYLHSQLVNRVIMPIKTDCGMIVAVATREPDPNAKGWWNTPFAKEACLYGMHAARNAAFTRNKLYLVEGYGDVLTLHQAGLLNVAGVMSATLSRLQVGVILRYCENICVCFDTDPPKNGRPGAGGIGLERIVATYIQDGFFDTISAIVMPLRELEGGGLGKDDPDDYVRRNGLEEYLKLERRVSKV